MDTEVSAVSPDQEWTVMPNGGRLRRGGGRPSESAYVTEMKDLIKRGAKDAVKALLQKARSGDTKAIEMVLHYAIGKPTEKVELSGPDGGPVEFFAGIDDHERALLRDVIDRATAELAEAATGSPEAGAGAELRQ